MAREEVHDWKAGILARYLEERQLQVFDPDGDNAYFVPNQLLVAGDVGTPVRTRLDRYGARRASGTVRLGPLGGRASTARPDSGGGPAEVVELDPSHGVDVAELAVELGDGWPGVVAPNHLVTGLQRRMGWPDGDPEPAPSRLPALPEPLPSDGARISVAIIDTGWPSRPPRRLDWFERRCDHATAPGEVDEDGQPLRHIDPLDQDRDGYLDVEAGHGLFVAGIVRRMAPRATLVFLKALNSDGVGTELGVARAIRYATARGVDLINLSLGFYTVRDATPAGVEAAVTAARAAGIAVVAAAGNDGLDSPTYPASFPGVTAVGALAADGTARAGFSNHGDWVEVYAPGEKVQSAFVRGREDPDLTEDTGSDVFRSNTALWSGTSFACGYVSGHLAAVLSRARPASGVPAVAASKVERAAEAIESLPRMAGSATSHRLDPQPAF
jgi:subtilisin family serine protease